MKKNILFLDILFHKLLGYSGTVGGESEFPGSFDTSGSVRTSNLYLASVRNFPYVKLPWSPCKQNRDRVVCKIKDVPKRSFGKGTKSKTSLW
jgi:hypothetical protein